MVEDKDEEHNTQQITTSEGDLKSMIRKTEQMTRATVLYLKTFNEVLTNIDIPTQGSNTDKFDNEGDDEEEEIIDSQDNINEIEVKISNTLNTIFQSLNFEPLQKMLNKTFLHNIVKFFCNLSVEEFLLNDFDKMITLKQLLYDLEYYTLSLINNIVFNFHVVLSNNLFNT
jgi:hypothetical protein